MEARGSWEQIVYSGLREFQQAKGYDPHSQDVARELGYPLYQVSSSSELDGSFAHVQDLSEEDESEKDEELSTNDCPRDELRYPFFQVTSERDGPFAQVQDLSEEDESEEKEHLSCDKYLREVVADSSSEPSELCLTLEFIHANVGFLFIPRSGKLPPLDNRELEPSRNWKIITGMQFLLILTLSVFYFYHSVRSRISAL
ncbi:hypothetical protein DFH09DRAFT_1331944 [Mycena vulgaris]|nr:hypothetical protein DFH09DRAFT_1331944 [Mycena vulgaris]